jgi:hypothetical protein
MRLTIYSPETAPDGSRTILDGIAADLGFVPNMAGTAAGSPALLAAGARCVCSGIGGLDSLCRACLQRHAVGPGWSRHR